MLYFIIGDETVVAEENSLDPRTKYSKKHPEPVPSIRMELCDAEQQLASTKRHESWENVRRSRRMTGLEISLISDQDENPKGQRSPETTEFEMDLHPVAGKLNVKAQ